MIKELFKDKSKKLAILIDPEKVNELMLERLEKSDGYDFVFIGGSILSRSLEETLLNVKNLTKKPVILFPGNAMQVSGNADGILYLSLISGRNPDFLIGNQVISAPLIKNMGLETVSTGYILVNCGNTTSVEYMSGTKPIPYEKTDIAVATAIAGEMLGLQALYLEGGSGAKTTITTSMISEVRKNTTIPLIVGGGIRSAEVLKKIYKAGADIAVVGTALENDPALLDDLVEVKKQF